MFLVTRKKSYRNHHIQQILRHPISTCSCLRNSLNRKSFCDLDALDDFLASKPTQFYEDGILKLPERWQKSHGKKRDDTIKSKRLI